LKRKRWIVIGFVLVVALLVGVNLVRLRAKPAAGAGSDVPKNAPTVKVAKLAARDLNLTVMGPATVEVGAPQEVRAPFATESAVVLVREGEIVKAGQVIARLESEEYALRVLGQEAAVERARLALTNLQEQAAVARQQGEQKVIAARAQLAQAEEALAAVSDRGGAQGRLLAAQGALEALQARAEASNAAVDAARLRVEAAYGQLQADPQNVALRQAYQEAEKAYQEAAEAAAKAADSLAKELVQAETTLRTAEREADLANKPDGSATLQAQSGVEAAKLALAAAQRELASGGNLAVQIHLAELDLRMAEATLKDMRERLAQAEVKAPIAGTVLAVGAKGPDGSTAPTSGPQPVQQGQVLLTLGNLAEVTVRVRVDEVDISKVKVGQLVTLRANGAPGESFIGKVTAVAAQAVGQGGQAPAFAVEALVQNKADLLRIGMSAEVEIVADQRSGVLVIGLQSLREDGGAPQVPVVEGNKVKLVPVKLGLRTSSEAEVIEGLKAGDQVIVSPFTLIRSVTEGMVVRVEAEAP
jgi:RND family efflux transporter MFP subunit